MTKGDLERMLGGTLQCQNIVTGEGGGGANPLVVDFGTFITDGTQDGVTADHKISEIYEAYLAGRPLVLKIALKSSAQEEAYNWLASPCGLGKGKYRGQDDYNMLFMFNMGTGMLIAEGEDGYDFGVQMQSGD